MWTEVMIDYNNNINDIVSNRCKIVKCIIISFLFFIV